MGGRFNFGEPVPLDFVLMINAQPVTGLTVNVVVQNSVTGGSLLSSTSCPEVSPGLYAFSWSNAITNFTPCVATWTIGSGRKFKDDFVIASIGGGSGSGSSPGLVVLIASSSLVPKVANASVIIPVQSQSLKSLASSSSMIPLLSSGSLIVPVQSSLLKPAVQSQGLIVHFTC